MSVEFGCMTFSDTNSEPFAFLIAVHHSLRSSSVAVHHESQENVRVIMKNSRTSIHRERLLRT